VLCGISIGPVPIHSKGRAVALALRSSIRHHVVPQRRRKTWILQGQSTEQNSLARRNEVRAQGKKEDLSEPVGEKDTKTRPFWSWTWRETVQKLGGVFPVEVLRVLVHRRGLLNKRDVVIRC
jgi:hypothetical protein